jgi:hypothetical protein
MKDLLRASIFRREKRSTEINADPGGRVKESDCEAFGCCDSCWVAFNEVRNVLAKEGAFSRRNLIMETECCGIFCILFLCDI